MMEVINLSYKFTNCYLLQSSCGWIMVDAGWPDTLYQLLHLLKQKDVPASDIKYLIVTHFHPDHAGLVQNFKDFGTNLILHESQVPFVDKLNQFFGRNPKANFKDIVIGNNLVLSSSETRRFLKSVGIDGEVIHTPGHSDDSISVIIDGCCAFTGDLPALSLMEAYNDQTLKDGWKLIQDYHVKKIYPAHGDSYNL
jgi:glyoxylase-like metal-dependent hydrolase (beta-lactamase superfamily II)